MDWLREVYSGEPILMRFSMLLVLVMGRVSGMVMTAPLFSTSTLPMRLRGLLAVAMTLLIMPLQWSAAFDMPVTLIDAAVLLGAELLIGILLGMGVMIIFSGVQVAGQLIGQLAGMSLADVFNPGFNDNVPLLSQLLFYVTLAVFVTIGGHRRIVEALLETYTAIPVGGGGLPKGMIDVVTTLLSQSFVLGVRAAAPAMTALLLSTLIMGLISRTMPQLNIMAFGFGLNALVTLGSLAVSLGAIAWIFQNEIDGVFDTFTQMLKGQSAASSQ